MELLMSREANCEGAKAVASAPSSVPGLEAQPKVTSRSWKVLDAPGVGKLSW